MNLWYSESYGAFGIEPGVALFVGEGDVEIRKDRFAEYKPDAAARIWTALQRRLILRSTVGALTVYELSDISPSSNPEDYGDQIASRWARAEIARGRVVIVNNTLTSVASADWSSQTDREAIFVAQRLGFAILPKPTSWSTYAVYGVGAIVVLFVAYKVFKG